MYLIAISNPSRDYKGTRHNLGRDLVDTLVDSYDFVKRVGISKVKLDDVEFNLAVHEGYMNESGLVLRDLLNSIEEKKIILIHDDTDIAVGDVKLSFNRSSGGHNGVQSVIDEIGSKKFYRFRIGIGEGRGKKEHVLGKYKDEEQKIFKEIFAKKIIPSLKLMVEGNFDEAVKLCNT